MAQMHWGMVCSVKKDEDLIKLEEFGKWFTSNVHKYGLLNNQLYNFADEPTFVKRLDGPMDTVYEQLCHNHPSVSFVLHILPHKGSPEFEKMKALTCRLSLIGQGVLLENALSKFAGADETAIFQNVNQYIARRFAQIVDFKNDKNEAVMMVTRQEVPTKGRVGCSYHGEDLHSTVLTVLHADKTMKFVQTQHDAKHFSNSAIISGLPEHYTRFQIAALFSAWPVESVLMTTRGCAFVEFFEPNGAYQAKKYYDASSFKDSETEAEHKITVCPIQSRYLRFKNVDSTLSKEKRVPFRDCANQVAT